LTTRSSIGCPRIGLHPWPSSGPTTPAPSRPGWRHSHTIRSTGWHQKMARTGPVPQGRARAHCHRALVAPRGYCWVQPARGWLNPSRRSKMSLVP
jgi:hypothetical protein